MTGERERENEEREKERQKAREAGSKPVTGRDLALKSNSKMPRSVHYRKLDDNQ